MSATTIRRGDTPSRPGFTPGDRPVVWPSWLTVASQPQTYRDIGYLLVGLPLGTTWFTVPLSGLAVGISMLVVALVGIPVLYGLRYVIRWCANVESVTANCYAGSTSSEPESPRRNSATRGSVCEQ